MPKKRNYNLKPFQGSSSSKHATASNDDGNHSPSVNERLSELRKLEGKDATAKKQQLAESLHFHQRSVPHLAPEIRGILGVPESAQPKPRVGLRARERMRTPGPAPPKSWLASGSAWTPTLTLRGGRRGLKKNADAKERIRPKRLLSFARLTGLEKETVDKKPSSLTHIALKTIAESWDLFEEDDYPALVEIPLRLRLRLISYIDFYGPPLDLRELEALLQGSEVVHHLDLASLVGHSNLSLRKITKFLERSQEGVFGSTENAVVESWDVEESFESALQPPMRTSRFSQLTHLCLSHPAPLASWRDLLALTKLTPQLTHLSLAYWPRPTLTPNLTTATVTSQHSPDVTAGGSHYYSTLDEDMTEPASLLRQLSGNLLCLQWLDLEGCQEWVPALGRLTASTLVVPNASRGITDNDDWAAGTWTTASVFSSNWKNLNYLRCAQGWLPSLMGIQSLHERDASELDRVVTDGVVKHMQEHLVDSGSSLKEPSQDVLDVEKKKARMWLQCEYKLRYTCMRVNEARRIQGCKPIATDLGWVH